MRTPCTLHACTLCVQPPAAERLREIELARLLVEDFAAPLPSLPPPGLEAAAEGGITGTKRSIDAVDEADEVEAKRST